MKFEDIRIILGHFVEEPIWPRTISTKTTRGRQIEVKSIEEVYARFEQANFIDCRINAYPAYTSYKGINRQAPNFAMCDLDLIDFKTEKLLHKTLSKTTENIVKDLGEGTEPTVLFTGNGYHVYRPIKLPVLENESVFTPFQNPSTEFIRYAAKRWTVGKNDPSNHPSVNSCMLRVPGSVNSKSNNMVEVIQRWSGSRPAANSMLYDFYINLAAQRFAIKSKKKHNWFQDTKYAGKNYKRIGYTYNSSLAQEIDWIEFDILHGQGISNYRQLTIDLVLAPYLVNIKKYGYDSAYNAITKWLDKCAQIEPLKFNAKYKVNYALNLARETCVPPMRLDTMKVNYSDMYKKIMFKR